MEGEEVLKKLMEISAAFQAAGTVAAENPATSAKGVNVQGKDCDGEQCAQDDSSDFKIVHCHKNNSFSDRPMGRFFE